MYVYIPDSYYREFLKNNNINDELFLGMQVKYKEAIELIIKTLLNFEKFDEYVNSFDFQVPIVDDYDYNFYRKFSKLGSKYLYLRNNIHIERLDEDEQDILVTAMELNKNLSEEFILKTLSKVLFEDGDFAYYGIPCNESVGKAKSIVFEFAYNELACELEESLIINHVYNEISQKISSIISNYFKVPVSMIKYDGIGDVYKNNFGIVNHESVSTEIL